LVAVQRERDSMHRFGRRFRLHCQKKASFPSRSLLRLLHQNPEPLQLPIASW